MQRLLLCTGVLASMFAAACGDDGGSISASDFLPKYIAAYCAHAVECGTYPDQNTCEEAQFLNGRGSLTNLADVTSGVVKFDGSKASACINEINAQSCEFTGFRGPVNDPCDDFATGTVASGGACNFGFECTSQSCTYTDATCDTSMMCCAGTCDAGAPVENVALGGTCADSDECVANAYCKFATQDDPTGLCTAQVSGVGTACDAIDACSGNLLCNPFATTHTCVQLAASGATCDPSLMFLACLDSRDYCDAGMKCSRLLDVGATCETTDDCNYYSECITGKCVAERAVGESCGTTDTDPACLGDADCVSGTCALPPAETSCK